MSSASRASLESVVQASQSASLVSPADARSVLAAARAIETNPQLQSALTDGVNPEDARASLAERAFASLAPEPRGIVANAARARWSSSSDIVDALEVVGIQLAARAAVGSDIGSELRQFADSVASSPELELTLNDRLAPAAGKAELVTRLIGAKAHESTLTIIDHLVRSPRGRRIRSLLTAAQTAVAGASGASLATVATARELPAAQLERLAAGLRRRYGGELRVTQVVDPTIIGGLRVTVGDDVIDGTLRTKYNDLRLQLG